MTSPMPPGQTSLLLQMTQRLALSDAHFRRICQLIYQRAGIVLADHKRDMVYNRLVRRLRTLGLDDFGRYLSMLEANQNSAEWQAFINSLTTNLTAFFREAHHFPVLAEHARRRSGEYRVWSAAASTGKSRTRWRSPLPTRWAWRLDAGKSTPVILIPKCWRRHATACIDRMN